MAKYEFKPPRASRAREAVPQYGTIARDQPLQAPGVYHVTVDERGRVMLPAEVREKLAIGDGDRVAVILEDDGTISLKTLEVALKDLQGSFKHLARPGKLASDELIAERRREAKMEDRKFREWMAYQRRMDRGKRR